MANQQQISETEKATIISLYNSGESSVSIGKVLDLKARTIVDRLKMWGIKRRTKQENGQKYDIDETYFDHINTEHKAYFLGLMYADGYNGESGLKYKVSLGLQAQDEHILITFRSELKSEHPIRIDKKNIAYLQFGNKRLSDQLKELGCGRKKSFTLTFPTWLSSSLLPHFIRGYVDGDGWVHFKRDSVTVGAIGSIPFIQTLANIIANQCSVHVSIRPHTTSPGITYLQVQGRDQVSTVLAWLYKDATVYLERKKRKAEAILTPVYYLNKPNGSDCHLTKLTESEVLQIKSQLASNVKISAIASQFGVSKTCIGDISTGRTWHHVTGYNERTNIARGQVKGTSHPQAKLTENDVLLIRERILDGEHNIDIAKHFNITRHMISKIRCGKCWTHITGFLHRS